MNHPNRHKPSRDALELIATFARGGIALDNQQQDAIAFICRMARGYKRIAEEACNGPPHWTKPDDAWQADIDKRRDRLRERLQQAFSALAPNGEQQNPFLMLRLGGDPRGATVKIVMRDPWNRLHDDWGREGVCVPGS